MKTSLIFSLFIVLLLLGACAMPATPMPAAPPTVLPTVPLTVPTTPPPTVAPTVPAATSTAAVPDDWQTYANPLGFSIRYPATWSQNELPQQAGETIHTVTLQGSEGGVDLHWGIGFGGACPQGYTTVKVAEGELPACYTLNADGTEVWSQIGKQLEATSFSADAHTSNAGPGNHDLILEILSTLSFPPPEQGAGDLTTPTPTVLPAVPAATLPTPAPDGWRTYTNPAGFSIRYPAATWSQNELPREAGQTYDTVAVQGPEGEVDLHWGVGFGGACPQGYTTIKVAEGELPACYTLNADGTELWTQINKQLETTSFSAEARTGNADPASHDLVLHVLSTLSFPSPEQGAADLTARMLTALGALAGPSPSNFNWSPVGAELVYVEPQDDQDVLWLYDAVSGENKVLLDPSKSPGNIDVTTAQWSPQGDRLLLTGDQALWLLDVETGDLQSLLADGNAKTAVMFTPDGAHVSYVQDNNLKLATIAGGEVKDLTTDGGETVFNGALDWVYNEELATRAAQPAYAWSPDDNWLVYLRLDESAVQNDPVTDYRPVPATVSYTRYPTVGTANPKASLHALTPGALAPPLEIPLPEGTEYVLPFFTWTLDSNHAFYITVNRDHTKLTLNEWTPQSGKTQILITEEDPYWINEERYAAPIFVGDGEQFLWVSERDGFMHLYLYGRDGTLIRQLTQGDWMIDSTAWNLLTAGRPVHVDPSGKWAYFETTQTGPLERQIERVSLDGGPVEQVSKEPGFHLFALSSDGKYLVDQFSDVGTPLVTRIRQTDGAKEEVLAKAADPALALPQVSREFVTVKAPDGTDLYAQLVKPANFDPARKYPVVVHWYGGPGLQMVSNRYGTTNIFNIIERDVLYTQEDMLVWRLDNRGSFGRGHAFETPIFGELGKVALADQLAGIEYLKTLPYVDASRIGTDGKSFGGYMTLYALLHALDVFRCGVAGAPPTDWSYYDTIYTERYMRTPDKNAEGYAATNLIDMAGQIQARPLLIHGLADTNVHLQNTVNFIQALEAADKMFDFIPLPNMGHSFKGDGLVAALSASADYLGACLSASPTAPAPGPAATAAPGVAPTATPTAEAALQPLSPETCAELAQEMATTLDVEVTQDDAPISDPATGASGTGCQATATGTGEQFTSPDAVVKELATMLEDQGWQEDPMLAAGGPTGFGSGFRKDGQVCLANAIWLPDASANCPQDQPISTCQLTPAQQLYSVTFDCAQSTASTTGMANPASVNCAKQGGTLVIEKRGDGGEFGVCYFEDNRQCEEWALLRGECPVGGVKVTGYLTPAARYCAISGGAYTVTGNSGQDDEQGTCTFKNGTSCDVWAYYDGTCTASVSTPSAEATPGVDTAASTPAPETAPPGGGAGQLVFDSNRGGAYRDLYVMAVDGAGVERLTEGDASSFAGPWSPDGKRIVYTCYGLTTSDICLINADGTGQINLTNTPSVDEVFPAWSPDGALIAYTSRADGNNNIYVMASDGSKPTRVTKNPRDEVAPTWSPDGKHLAFASDRDRKEGIYDIYIIGADGAGVRRLTRGGASNDWPAWSPDGKQIAFRSTKDGQADIMMIGVDGGKAVNLTDDPADDWAPAWSPDGSQIAFQSDRTGNWEIYVMTADGNDPSNLTNDPVDDQLPHWQP